MMKKAHYELAQVNIAKARAPLDDPIMSGFVNQLATINALADASAGFVWRMQSETGDNLYVRPYDDPLIIFNLSVWESVGALKSYVYRMGHGTAVRDRKLWFTKMDSVHLAMWWIPAGHRPSVEEAKERLAFREQHGDTAIAFSFARRFEMPTEPESAADHEDGAAVALKYEGRTFALRSGSESGDCGGDTLFHYRQLGARVWATYAGSGVRFGSLVALSDAAGGLRGCYHHLNARGELREGRYVAHVEREETSKMVIRERWHTNAGEGESVLEEVG